MAQGLKILVVDDSAFARSRVRKRLLADPGITVVETASDGIAALEKLTRFHPDVITLDVQMPRMDGITALKRIMATVPTPVVMVSGLTGEDSATTIKALELGAVDFFLKPDLSASSDQASSMDGLTATVKTAAKVRLSKLASADEAAMREALRLELGGKSSNPPTRPEPRRGSQKLTCLVVIASSTGGPKALAQLIPKLPVDDRTGFLLVQHMPPGFTKSLSERLNRASELTVREAEEGDVLEPRLALMAPGGFHMTVGKNGRIHLNDGPTVHGVRPSADVTMKSTASLFNKNTIAAVLTGMGVDGRDGVRAIKAAGGSCVVEHESTCAVYGMPRAIADAGLSDAIVPLGEIAAKLSEFISQRFVNAVGATR